MSNEEIKEYISLYNEDMEALFINPPENKAADIQKYIKMNENILGGTDIPTISEIESVLNN